MVVCFERQCAHRLTSYHGRRRSLSITQLAIVPRVSIYRELSRATKISACSHVLCISLSMHSTTTKHTKSATTSRRSTKKLNYTHILTCSVEVILKIVAHLLHVVLCKPVVFIRYYGGLSVLVLKALQLAQVDSAGCTDSLHV